MPSGKITGPDVADPGPDGDVRPRALSLGQLGIHDADGLKESLDGCFRFDPAYFVRNIDGKNDIGAVPSGRVHGNGADHPAVHIGAVPDPYGLEYSRDGAARPDRSPRIS